MAFMNSSLPYEVDLPNDTTTASSVDPNGTTMAADKGGEEGEIGVVFYVMLSIFVVVGSIGNALAIYVFASLKQKLTSTIFILTLAGTDFLTCVITLPFTMYMEHVEFHVGSDFVCKIYHFLSTTTVPFSALVMVAIAVDRYMCICHPFYHWMTIPRARIIIASLLALVSIYGIIICMHYSINNPETITMNLTSRLNIGNGSTGNDSFLEMEASTATAAAQSVYNVTYDRAFASASASASESIVAPTKKVHLNPECRMDWSYIDPSFLNVFKNLYNANFVISCVLVLILYSLIYRYVISQRRKKLRIKSAQCCFLWNARSIETHHESVEITQDIELSNVNGDRYKTRLMSSDEAVENHNNGSTRKCSISKARIERMRVANIKTAFTLFIVNVVFIVAFLPAWLMVMKFIDMYILVFYMHFFYNVCNPLIYAFLNQNFKTELKRILHCGKV